MSTSEPDPLPLQKLASGNFCVKVDLSRFSGHARVFVAVEPGVQCSIPVPADGKLHFWEEAVPGSHWRSSEFSIKPEGKTIRAVVVLKPSFADVPEQAADFQKPPVNEVVCGIQFKQPVGLRINHYGMLWEKFRQRYPICEEAESLFPSMEQSGKAQLPIFVPDIHLRPRMLLVSRDGNTLIQVQADRFLFNWRRRTPQDNYPKYELVYRAFSENFAFFQQFLDEAQLGKPIPAQYEITYVDHIHPGDGWKVLSDLGDVFPDLAWRKEPRRFLSMAESFFWRSTFLMPDQMGALHVTIRNGVLRDQNAPVLLLEFTSRGFSAQEGMKNWFDRAHAWTVRAFLDLTSKHVQDMVWKRKR